MQAKRLRKAPCDSGPQCRYGEFAHLTNVGAPPGSIAITTSEMSGRPLDQLCRVCGYVDGYLIFIGGSILTCSSMFIRI